MRRWSVKRLCALLALSLSAPAAVPLAAEAPVDKIEVTAARLAPEAGREAFAITRLTGDDLAAAPQARLDDLLRQVPGFSLFRRSSSRVAHPTTQGVTLRSLGPNGAGRTLVLLDGIPQNDPFGGWVYWSSFDPQALSQVDIISGGGAGPWGNGALAGVIELRSKPVAEDQVTLAGSFGAFDTAEIKGNAAARFDRTAVSLAGYWSRSDGYFLLGPEQRGPVDIRAASDDWRIAGRLEQTIADDLTLFASLSYFEEDRTNGLALSVNSTEAFDLSAGLTQDGGAGEVSWQIAAYYRNRDFRNSFASVDDDRLATRIVLDQFDVPAEGSGFNGLIRLPLGGRRVLEAGIDFRSQDGETNELFRNLGAGFTRLRQAGGEEILAGGYLEYSDRPLDKLTYVANIRLDYWETSGGLIRERDLADNTIIRDDPIQDRNDLVLNGRVGIGYDATGAILIRAAAYTGFRLPTINEFFRPFRVRNDITEANPNLKPERVYGLDFGVEYRPLNAIFLSAGYFRNWLKDGVGNVTLAMGPGFFPPTGFVPDDGSLRQRQNIDRIAADGFEFASQLNIASGWEFEASYLFVNSRVTANRAAPELIGNRLQQSPKHQGSLGVNWRPDEHFQAIIQGRFQTDQFEDDLNQRVLDGFFTLDARVSYEIRDGASIYAAGENLFDKRIEAGLDGAGLLTLGQPRIWTVGFRLGL